MDDEFLYIDDLNNGIDFLCEELKYYIGGDYIEYVPNNIEWYIIFD